MNGKKFFNSKGKTIFQIFIFIQNFISKLAPNKFLIRMISIHHMRRKWKRILSSFRLANFTCVWLHLDLWQVIKQSTWILCVIWIDYKILSQLNFLLSFFSKWKYNLRFENKSRERNWGWWVRWHCYKPHTRAMVKKQIKACTIHCNRTQ